MKQTVEPQTKSSPSACPICNGNRLAALFEVQAWAQYEIVRCGACNAVFSSPRPTPEELNTFYTSEYFKRTEDDGHGYSDYRSMAEVNARRMWHHLKDYAPLGQVTPKRVLDVGCATGGFLAEAKRDGWDCVGVELSQYAVDVARSEFGIDVLQGDAFLPALETGKFGLVTMWHVLEHLIDPIATLQRAHDLLAPGGLLFVELPNWDSLGRVVKGSGWKQIKPPEHINYLTPCSLRVAAKRVSLEVMRCDTHYPSLVDKAAVRRASQPFHAGVALIAAAACKLGHGGYARLLARKKSS